MTLYKYFSCKKQGDRKQLPKVALFSTILKIVDSNREKEIRAQELHNVEKRAIYSYLKNIS